MMANPFDVRVPDISGALDRFDAGYKTSRRGALARLLASGENIDCVTFGGTRVSYLEIEEWLSP